MFRFTPILRQTLRKSTTGITGLAVHPDPLPELCNTYRQTLALLSAIPATSAYRQGVEGFTNRKLKLVQSANGDIAAAEATLGEGQIEESLDIATDELNLVSKMIEWKPYVLSLPPSLFLPDQLYSYFILLRWEQLVEKPEPGQWNYPGLD
jgi:NADH dehydrogenase (ubiquinone) 1 alpha subcomplex subunit 5